MYKYRGYRLPSYQALLPASAVHEEWQVAFQAFVSRSMPVCRADVVSFRAAADTPVSFLLPPKNDPKFFQFLPFGTQFFVNN